MAKAKIEFDLNEPDDKMAHFRAVKSTDMAIALFDIQYNLRKELEHSIESKELKGEEVTPYDVINLTMDRLIEIIQDNNINLDELIN